MSNKTLYLQKYKYCLTELEIEGIFWPTISIKTSLIFEVSGWNLHSQQDPNFDSSILKIVQLIISNLIGWKFSHTNNELLLKKLFFQFNWLEIFT